MTRASWQLESVLTRARQFLGCRASRSSRHSSFAISSMVLHAAILSWWAVGCGARIDESGTDERPVEMDAGNGGSACDLHVASAKAELDGPQIVDDLEDGDLVYQSNGRSGAWFAYDDGGPGAQRFELAPSLLFPETFSVRLQGNGFTDHAGFGVTLLEQPAGNRCAYDGHVYQGIHFWARGSLTLEDPEVDDPHEIDRERLRVLLVEPGVIPLEEGGECNPEDGTCWDSFKDRISLGECWKHYILPFQDFSQDGWGVEVGELDRNRLVSIQFEVAENHEFDVQLDHLSFFVEAPEPKPDVCVE